MAHDSLAAPSRLNHSHLRHNPRVPLSACPGSARTLQAMGGLIAVYDGAGKRIHPRVGSGSEATET